MTLVPVVEGMGFVVALVAFFALVLLLSLAETWWKARRRMRGFDAEVVLLADWRSDNGPEAA